VTEGGMMTLYEEHWMKVVDTDSHHELIIMFEDSIVVSYQKLNSYQGKVREGITK
jgi:hypothetical protein